MATESGQDEWFADSIQVASIAFCAVVFLRGFSSG